MSLARYSAEPFHRAWNNARVDRSPVHFRRWIHRKWRALLRDRCLKTGLDRYLRRAISARIGAHRRADPIDNIDRKRTIRASLLARGQGEGEGGGTFARGRFVLQRYPR